MRKFILRCGTMFLTFTLGLATNSLVSVAVERWLETPVTIPEQSEWWETPAPITAHPDALVQLPEQLRPDSPVTGCGPLLTRPISLRPANLLANELAQAVPAATALVQR